MSRLDNSQNIQKSLSTNSIFGQKSRICSARSSDDIFKKIHQNFDANTNGECPKILYKKQGRENYLLEMKFKQSDYINDAGYSKKRNFLNEFTQSMRNFNPHAPSNSTTRFQKAASKTTRMGMNSTNNNINNKSTHNNNQTNLNETKHKRMMDYNNKVISNKTNSEINIFNASKKQQKIEEHKRKSSEEAKNSDGKIDDEIKKEQMENLVENGIMSIIKHFNDEVPEPEDKLKRKMLALENAGVDLNESALIKESTENNNDEDEEDPLYNDFEVEENSKDKKIHKTRKSQSYGMTSHSIHSNDPDSMLQSKSTLRSATTKKVKRKPQVDCFEFLNQMGMSKRNKNNNIGTSTNNFNTVSNRNPKLSSHSNSNSNTKMTKTNKYMVNNYVKTPTCLQKLEEKQKEEEKNKNEKLKRNYKDLLDLELQKQPTFYLIKRSNTTKSKLSISSGRDSNKKGKHKPKGIKIKNDYYIGDRASKQEISTIIDNDNFLEELIKGKLVIDGDPYYNLTSSKIREVTKKYSDYDPNSNTEKSFEKLKEKAKKTIKKMNDIEKSENFDNLLNDKNKKSENNEMNNINYDESKSNNNNNQSRLSKHSRSNSNSHKEDSQQLVLPDELNQEYVDVEPELTTSNVANTIEKELPTLPHNFQNETNPNQKITIEVEPQAVLRLVELIKILVQRKVFFHLYEIYYNMKICERYVFGFTLLNMILKKKLFYQFALYCDYITYFQAFRKLFLPFIKKKFKFFVERFKIKDKVEFLVAFLSAFVKNRVLANIFSYGYSKMFIEEQSQKILSVLKICIRPYLREAFEDFVERVNQKKTLKKNDSINSNCNNDIKSKSYAYESFSDKSCSVEPNSQDSDRLHRLQVMLSKDAENHRYDNNNDSQLSEASQRSKSNKSTSSVKDIMKKKPGISLNLSKSLSNKSNKDFIKRSLSEKSFSSKSKKSGENSFEDESSEKIRIKDYDKISRTSSEKKEMSSSKKESPNKSDIPDNNNNNNNKPANKEEDENKVKDEKKINEKKPTDVKELPKKKVEEKKKEEIKDGNDKKNIPIKEGIEKPKQEKEKKQTVEDKLKFPEENIKDDEEIKEEIEKDDPIEEVLPLKIQNSDSDVLADEDKSISNIDWIMNLTENNRKESPQRVRGEKKNSEEFDYGGFDKEVDSDNNSEILEEIIPIKDEEEKKDEEKKPKPEKKEEKKKEEKKEEKKKEETKEETKEEKKEETKEEKKQEEIPDEKPKQQLQSIDKEKLAEEIMNELTKQILEEELSKRVVPKKKLKFDPFTNNLLNNSSSLSISSDVPKLNSSRDSSSSKDPYNISINSLNDSIMSSYTAMSVFNRTVVDKKKEKINNLYLSKIAPALIELIKKEIINKYKDIYENLTTPIQNNYKEILISLSLQNSKMLKENYHTLKTKKDISEIINKPNLLKTFEPINQKIRTENNLNNDNTTDKCLNECLIDTVIELINKERIYGESGEPFKHSSRKRIIRFKFDKTNPKYFADYIEVQINKLLNTKLGLIAESKDYVSAEQINMEREKRIFQDMKQSLANSNESWDNLDLEETQLKLETCEIILDQLNNEIIEILEHIQYSRKKPMLYQNKSIYSCAVIPKLSFQYDSSNETSENNDEDNDMINM